MRSAVAILALFLSSVVLAAGNPANKRDHNRFKWRDGEGDLHYSDALPAEAAKYGYEVINPQGVVVKRVEREKTPEERAAAQAELARIKAEKDQAAARVKADQQMLAAYPTEDDLKHAQQLQTDMMDQTITSAHVSLESQEKSLADLLGHAAELDRSGKSVPTTLAKRIGEARKDVEEQRAYIARKERERSENAERFRTELEHYRDLKAKLAASRR